MTDRNLSRFMAAEKARRIRERRAEIARKREHRDAVSRAATDAMRETRELYERELGRESVTTAREKLLEAFGLEAAQKYAPILDEALSRAEARYSLEFSRRTGMEQQFFSITLPPITVGWETEPPDWRADWSARISRPVKLSG